MIAPPRPERVTEDVALEEVRGGLGAVPGIRLAGVHAGLKKRKTDLALIAFDEPQYCAAVVTTNEIKAAPLVVTAEHLAATGASVRAIVCNSGCANACTGERGERDARATAHQTATLLGIDPREVVLASTGVIGVYLPIDRVVLGLERAARDLAYGAKAAHAAAEAIMTTDCVPKLAARAFYAAGRRYVVGGIAKGSGMIAPNMATMLAFVATDAPLSREALQRELTAASDRSFNAISVDGDMSTNDAVYAFASQGDGDGPPGFAAALQAVTRELAIAMVRDGEGATKTLTLEVSGARDGPQARAIARAIVDSSLVKTALFGEDPNWGRVIAAAGSARAGLDPQTWSLFLNGLPWVGHDAIELLSGAAAHHELTGTAVTIGLDLGIGEERATAWGCDLSLDYVRINAHYRT